jgi:flagellar hook-associated protein 1 FlgK
MSLSSALQTAASGLQAAQAGLRVVSDNIANVNTPGYVRKTLVQTQLVADGAGAGVRIEGIQRVTDQYLQSASLTASSDSSKYSVVAQYLDNAQSLFGNPSSDSFFFNRLNNVYDAFASAADDPSSSLLRTQAVSNVQNFLNEAGRVNAQVNQLGASMDSQISGDVDQANSLLGQIDKLNTDISRSKVLNADSSGSENTQSALIDQLAALMNVKVTARDGGGVNIRSQEGILLAGDGAATLTYNSTATTRGYISAVTAGSTASQAIGVSSGEIQGLMQLRDTALPQISDQLGEYVSRAVQQLNAAHNASSAVPPPSALTGRDTGMDLPTAVSNFTGKTSIAIVNGAGLVQRQVDIDFDAGTMSTDGGVTTSGFTAASFQAQLNAALAPSGTASVSANGALSIAASAAGTGVAIDEGTSAKAGQGFSQFFGLNDLITSRHTTTYETGLAASDPDGFVSGGQITLRLADASGKPLTDVTVTLPSAPSDAMSDLLSALNNSATGVGLYGSFALDARGALSFTGSAPTNANLSVVQDLTQRTVGGASLSDFFGLGVAQQTSRAGDFQVNQTLAANPTQLALAKLNLAAAAGQPVLAPGDGRGALALSEAGNVATQFTAFGSLGAVNTTVSNYGSQFSGGIGRQAAAAEASKTSATAVATEATTRRQSVEGVNLDEELVNLTTFQQAFNASARMVQAAKDMYDVLLGIVT